MGEAKQLLRLGESTVLGRTIENVRRSAVVDEIVLVLGASAEAIRRRLPASLLEGLNVVVNPAYEQGMASSLRAGLSALDPQIGATLTQYFHGARIRLAFVPLPLIGGIKLIK